MKKKQGYAIGISTFLLALLLGNSLAGIEAIGYKAECTDGIDNNSDGGIDALDNNCFEYPYEDGNGETSTPVGERGTGDEYSSLFEYHRDYGDGNAQTTLDTVCIAISFAIYNPGDLQDAQAFVDAQGGCSSGP